MNSDHPQSPPASPDHGSPGSDPTKIHASHILFRNRDVPDNLVVYRSSDHKFLGQLSRCRKERSDLLEGSVERGGADGCRGRFKGDEASGEFDR